jgi:hypothetical protein
MTLIALILGTLLLFTLAIIYSLAEVGGSFLLGLARVERPKKSKVPYILFGLSAILLLYTFVYVIHNHIRFV